MLDPIVQLVGLGTDLHRMEPGRKLVLGGVEIPFDKGPVGHSDGDVAIHAMIDALLGAAGLPDIGERFPDTDPRYTGIDSRLLLKEVIADLHRLNLQPVNIDLVIQTERPKLSTFKPAIRASIAGLLGLPTERISIKAKTGEGVDAIGRGEAIACLCVVGLTRSVE
jgi:2-C-methyl-D-erythritol 2,4-cyclodiphosphate synthase